MGLSSNGRSPFLLLLSPCEEQAMTKPIIQGRWDTCRADMNSTYSWSCPAEPSWSRQSHASQPADVWKLNADYYLPLRFVDFFAAIANWYRNWWFQVIEQLESGSSWVSGKFTIQKLMNSDQLLALFVSSYPSNGDNTISYPLEGCCENSIS